MKISELTGAALDWAVTFALYGEQARYVWKHNNGIHNYSTRWERAGPIIEGENIGTFPRIDWPAHQQWSARKCGMDNLDMKAILGPTPLIAAMRCYVASKLGDEVEVPDGLA